MADAVDIDTILTPISKENPTGVNIRENKNPTSAYQKIKGARNSARAAERQSIHDGNSHEANAYWRTVLTLAPEILVSDAKDLEIACWYTEAAIRLRGFEGLFDAFTILRGLIDTFWEDLHPMPDEDGMETRTSCIAGLNGEGIEGVIIAPIRKIVFTESIDNNFNLWQYQQALEVQKNPDDKIRLAKESKIGFKLTDIEKSVEETTDTYFITLRDTIKKTIELYKAIGIKLDEYCSLDNAPSIRTVIDVLEECLGAINHLGKNKLPVSNEELLVESAAESEITQVTDRNVTIISRQDAFKQLQHIAEFFRTTEPHSPVSYVLEKAVKWGNMPLDQLISELIPDSSSRSHYSELTGVIENQE